MTNQVNRAVGSNALSFDERRVDEMNFCDNLLTEEARQIRIALDNGKANMEGARREYETRVQRRKELDERIVQQRENLDSLLRGDKSEDAVANIEKVKASLRQQEDHSLTLEREENAWKNNWEELSENQEKLTRRHEELEEPRLKELEQVRAFLKNAGIVVAQQIWDLGCTGFFSLTREKKLFDSDEAAIERLNWFHQCLEGSGAAMTCYVDRDHYCHIHRTVGGLQEGQESRHAEVVSRMSRELTLEERGHIAFVDKARRQPGATGAERMIKAHTMLTGADQTGLPVVAWPDTEGPRWGDGVSPASPEEDAQARLNKVREVADKVGLDLDELGSVTAFTCPDHKDPLLSCRCCLAQLVVDGPLAPVLGFSSEEGVITLIEADEAEKYVQEFGGDGLKLFVQAASWTRRLARDSE